jgi:hypothetical protein
VQHPGHDVKRQSIRPLDARRTRHHNGDVRLRPILIALALLVLAFAGLRHDDAGAPHTGGVVASQLSSQPAPDHEPPTIVRAAVTASATAQTHVACEPRGHARTVLDVSSDGRQAPPVPAYRATLPQSFPLLI